MSICGSTPISYSIKMTVSGLEVVELGVIIVEARGDVALGSMLLAQLVRVIILKMVPIVFILMHAHINMQVL